MPVSLLDPLPARLSDAVRLRVAMHRPLVDLTRVDGPDDVLQANLDTARRLVRDSPVEVDSHDDRKLVLRIPRTHADDAWTLGLVDEQGILVAPGTALGLGPGLLVVSLRVPSDVFTEAMRTLVQFVTERSYGC